MDFIGMYRYSDGANEPPPRPDLYDQDADLLQRETVPMGAIVRALMNEQLLRWEADFRQPNYYDWFLTEVTP